ncbi:MAG: tetratricopeptide repeat protein [Bacteroidetes bacterium]|nr:tetratricopeptide repeat protein [Bacteroidota bacterium]
MKYILLILAIFFTSMNTFSQNEKKFIREGNKLYEQKKFNDAEVNYRKSLQKDSNYFKGRYNLANALYKQKNYDEASRLYSTLVDKEKDGKIKSNVYHNLGNSYLQKKEFEKSIDAYKQSLKYNPKDYDTKYNLSYAMQMLKQQQQQQKNKDNKDNKDKKDDKNKQDQNKDKQQENKENQDKKQQEQQKQKQVKKEDAERMLEALKNDEKKTMDKVKKEKAIGVKAKIEKDW